MPKDYGKLKSERTPELDDCSETVKKGLIGMNFLFMLFGLTLLGVGIYMFVTLTNVKSLLSMGLPIALLIIGTFICMLSCFGCCGAIKRSKTSFAYLSCSSLAYHSCTNLNRMVWIHSNKQPRKRSLQSMERCFQ